MAVELLKYIYVVFLSLMSLFCKASSLHWSSFRGDYVRFAPEIFTTNAFNPTGVSVVSGIINEHNYKVVQKGSEYTVHQVHKEGRGIG